MQDDIELDEEEHDEIRAENEELIKTFAAWLTVSGLTPATVNKHCVNIEFYINEYLLSACTTYPEAGMNSVDISMFMGYWFIKTASWASASSLKSNAASLKKFGQFLFTRGQIDHEELQSLITTIRDEMPDWQATMARYDDPNIENMEDVWGW